MANSALNVSSLDFDTLKSNFITFLKSQSTFKDYNFEGSNMNVLLDVMAYNSYLNSFYLNMVASEMFMDSAQKLDSVISHAKELNYLPRSTRSSKALVSFNVDTVGIENPFIIPKGTIFSGSNSNGSFNFVTDQENSYLSTNSIYQIVDLELYEGSYTKDTFLVDRSNENQQFIFSNKNIDTNSLTVTVSENGGVSNTAYYFTENLYNIKDTSKVYFLQANENQKYQLLFGDGVFGYKPKNGAIVYTQYRVASGSAGNGIDNMNIDQNLGTINGGTAQYTTITVLSPSDGGADWESIDSIKYNAPRYYQTQNRCITSQDYSTVILQNFPEIQNVHVFGGEVTNNNVEFGIVYISSSTYSGAALTNSRKIDLETYVNKLSPIGITTKIIDPEYLYITLTTTAYVNFKQTLSSPPLIKSKIVNSIKSFNLNNLQNFDTSFRLSKLEASINDLDDGILSNETYTKLYKTFTPKLNLNYSIFCDLQNTINKGSLVSSKFYSNGKLLYFTDYINGIDNVSGIVYIFEDTTNYYAPIGVVNYVDGIITISEIEYSDIIGGIKIYGTPIGKDLYCRKNTIIEIDTSTGLTINTVSQ